MAYNTLHTAECGIDLSKPSGVDSEIDQYTRTSRVEIVSASVGMCSSCSFSCHDREGYLSLHACAVTRHRFDEIRANSPCRQTANNGAEIQRSQLMDQIKTANIGGSMGSMLIEKVVNPFIVSYIDGTIVPSSISFCSPTSGRTTRARRLHGRME